MLGKLRAVKIGGRNCIYLRATFEAERYISTKMDALELINHVSDADIALVDEILVVQCSALYDSTR